MALNSKFWLKCAAYMLTPGGYGYYRRLRGHRDPTYVPGRDKSPVRARHYGSEGWKAQWDLDGTHHREYADYGEYVEHQSAKFDEMIRGRGGFRNLDVLEYRWRFFRRFRHLRGYLPSTATILCAGARQGTEVEVLRDLGYANAYGVDLNPGPDNPWVEEGDFMRLGVPDHSLDLIYSNAVDHAFDLERFFAEHSRATKPGGYALYDIADQRGGAFEAVEWTSAAKVVDKILAHFPEVVLSRDEGTWQWYLVRNSSAGSR